jgi:hypothetical protein
MLAFNPNGREGPEVAGRQEGFLFYVAWLGHQSLNIFTNADAHGVFRPVLVVANCATLKMLAANNPPFDELAYDLTGAITDSDVCGGTGTP